MVSFNIVYLNDILCSFFHRCRVIDWKDSARQGLPGTARWAGNRYVIVVSEMVIVDWFS